ncbi:hypothetical protein [Candidatus Palauibacter sp.]|uniref:hypothetical protein n=1 Tax=Candidatus Palauibacter sp. TaxID=3101350 RepID=UPI003C6EA8B5
MIGKKVAKVNRRIRCALIMTLAVGPLTGIASAQEQGDAAETIQNVQLIFHLVEADGFTDEDIEISDVVAELRKLFNFRGYRLLSTSMLNVGLAQSMAGVTGSGSQRIIAHDSETPLTIQAEVSARRSARTVRAKVTLTDVFSRWSLLEASVTIRDGQRVVLGSARRSAEEPVLILVVTPRIDPT